jgi:hypothetical protein
MIAELTAGGYLPRPGTERAVKGHPTLDRRAGGRIDHLEGPGEQSASKEGWRPPTPSTPSMSSFSRGFAVPLEESDTVCGTVVLFRLEDGRLLARRVDCRTKACDRCGPRLRAAAAKLWAQVMAGQVVYRLLVADADWSRYQRKLRKVGAEYGVIPAPDGWRVVYTTAPIGEPLIMYKKALTSDFAAMPSDRRQKRLSTRWLALARELEDDDDQVVTQPAECLGILRRPLEQVAMIAEELDMLVGEAGSSGLYLRDPEDPATWRRFCALTRLYRRGRDEVIAA